MPSLSFRAVVYKSTNSETEIHSPHTKLDVVLNWFGREWNGNVSVYNFNDVFCNKFLEYDFFCVGVMYSGEYDACDVTLSVYPHRAGLKNMPGHGGNRTYDLWKFLECLHGEKNNTVLLFYGKQHV